MLLVFRALVSVLIVDLALGTSISRFQDFDEWRRAVGAPGIAGSPATPDKCKKDLLILLDTSYSIGSGTFDNKVKPFLKNLIRSPKLNVSPDGTHIALITFSNQAQTKERFGFGKYDTAKDLENYIDQNLLWNQVSGDFTMTGTAFQLADTQVFPKDSPLNARSNIADVVLLITDGEPRGNKRDVELNMALQYSAALKNRDVLIVTVAVGSNRHNFMDNIKKMATSSDTMFDAEFDGLDKLIDNLVDASCTPFKPGDCTCPTIVSQDIYLKPSETTKSVDWVEPTLQCNKDRVPNVQTSVNPSYTSPHNFGVGVHDIVYTYTFSGGFDIKCTVTIVVKACACPASSKVIAYDSGTTGLTVVNWNEPSPSCPSTLSNIQPNTPSGSTFTVGNHQVNYVYATAGGFDLTCKIDIEVKKCVCHSNEKKIYMNPDRPNGQISVNWVEPKPDCPGQSISRTTINPSVKPGASFGVGSHKIEYTYDMSNGDSLKCQTDIVVKVVPCQGVDYDPKTDVCCCGKLQKIKQGYQCCGRRQYEITQEKCCAVNYNIVPSKDSCPASGVSF